MLNAAFAIASKDLRLLLSRGTGLVQALLLGLLLIFVFSLSQRVGEVMGPQGPPPSSGWRPPSVRCSSSTPCSP